MELLRWMLAFWVGALIGTASLLNRVARKLRRAESRPASLTTSLDQD